MSLSIGTLLDQPDSKTEKSNLNMHHAELEKLAATLAASPEYRVLRRINPRIDLAPDTGSPLLKGVIVDTETTDLDSSRGRVIEIGIVAFEYDPATGQPIRVTDTYGELEDPGQPLSPEITAITEITDEMVSGKKIDEARVASLVADASIVVAHNAEFDRPFLENRLTAFDGLPWGCSMMDIDWTAENVGSRKLDYIAFQMGFFFDAHRAEEDCKALLEILAHPLPVSGTPVLKPLLDRLPQVSYTLFAINSPYSTKDLLKARKYRWDGDQKVWHRTVVGKQSLEEEVLWLKSAIYGGRPAKIDVVERDARTRFSRKLVTRTTRSI
jgi:DNA polymerase-3 subunit epsilon